MNNSKHKYHNKMIAKCAYCILMVARWLCTVTRTYQRSQYYLVHNSTSMHKVVYVIIWMCILYIFIYEYKLQNHKENKSSIEHAKRYSSLKTEGELRCSGRVSSSFFTCDTRQATLVTNPVISHEWEYDQITTNGTYPWSFVTQILRIG